MGLLKQFDTSVRRRDTVVEGNTPYNIIQPGLSYSGVCRNPKCSPAKGKTVICNRGFGNFLVNDDISLNTIICPMCSSPFELESIGLFQCRAECIIHAHQEQRELFVAKGLEIVKIGKKADSKAFALPDALMTLTVKDPDVPSCVAL